MIFDPLFLFASSNNNGFDYSLRAATVRDHALTPGMGWGFNVTGTEADADTFSFGPKETAVFFGGADTPDPYTPKSRR
jgi:hypothetical protein